MDAQVTHTKQPIQPHLSRTAVLPQASAPRWLGRALIKRVSMGFSSVAMLLISAFTLAQGASPTAAKPSHVIVTPDQLVWKPLLPGSEVAVVSGNPDAKSGVYVRIRTKGDLNVPPHWHVTDEHVTVLEGSFWMAHGDQFDATKLKELKVGSHSLMPAGFRHFGLHKAGNLIEVFGEAPFVINFVNPEDDPNRGKIK